MPITHRRAVRTTDLLECRFVEERRQPKIIPNACGEKPVLKLMYGAMIGAAEHWRPCRNAAVQEKSGNPPNPVIERLVQMGSVCSVNTSRP
jgi:hypothetical protein